MPFSGLWTQHAASGDSRYFQTIAELLHFVEQHAGDMAIEGGEMGKNEEQRMEMEDDMKRQGKSMGTANCE